MPLVRIDVPSSMNPDTRRVVGDVVYETLVAVLNVPEHDNFQIITAHDPADLRIDPQYLDIERSPEAFIVSITLNAGRSVDLKRQFYAELVERLHTRAEVRPQDVMIVLTEVAKENWSFGNGVAQYA
jgi:phenylpyruvate tautomerase PptA (4-oxalocrotonate tautomerase family)